MVHVGLCGPCTPAFLVDLLHRSDSEDACRYPGSGGLPVADLARGLRQAGHTVSVFTMAGKADAPSALFRGAGLTIQAVASRHSRQSTLDFYRDERAAMASAIRQAAPDIVHTHWTYEYELAAQAGGIPHVSTAHDCPVTVLRQFRDPYRMLRLLLALRARPGIRHLSAVSPYTAQNWRRYMAYRRRIEVIPNALPADFAGLVRRPAQNPTILEIANGTRLKNVGSLLRAFQIVRAREWSAQLRLAGPGLGPDDSLSGWASQHGLADGVVFLGLVDRPGIVEEFSRAWVLAHASLEEACPMVLLEALTAGVPAVGGENSGGVPYVLDHGRAGRLTDVNDPAAFAVTILEALDAADSSSTHLHAARFAPRAVTTQYTDWYNRVLSDARP